MLSGDHRWSSGRGLGGVNKGAQGPIKRTLFTILKPQSHRVVNTGNKGAKVRKDTLCFGGGGRGVERGRGGHCPSSTQSLFINAVKMLTILHCFWMQYRL